MAAVIRDARHAGGRAYGYRPVRGERGKPTIVDAQATIVRRIFAEWNTGRTARDIAHDLNRDRDPPPRGQRWNAWAIYGNATRHNGIIRNPPYAGALVWNRLRMVKDPDTGRRVSRLNPRAEAQLADLQKALAAARDQGNEDIMRRLGGALRDLIRRDPTREGGIELTITGRLNALLGEKAFPGGVRNGGSGGRI